MLLALTRQASANLRDLGAYGFQALKLRQPITRALTADAGFLAAAMNLALQRGLKPGQALLEKLIFDCERIEQTNGLTGDTA